MVVKCGHQLQNSSVLPRPSALEDSPHHSFSTGTQLYSLKYWERNSRVFPSFSYLTLLRWSVCFCSMFVFSGTTHFLLIFKSLLQILDGIFFARCSLVNIFWVCGLFAFSLKSIFFISENSIFSEVHPVSFVTTPLVSCLGGHHHSTHLEVLSLADFLQFIVVCFILMSLIHFQLTLVTDLRAICLLFILILIVLCFFSIFF